MTKMISLFLCSLPLPLLLLLLLLCGVSKVDAVSQSAARNNLRGSTDAANRRTEVYALYNIPAFSLTFTVPADSTRSISQITTAVRDVTQTYLKDYFLATSLRTETTLEALKSIDLDISVKESTTAQSTRLQYYAEMYGTAAFVDPADRPPLALAQALMQKLVVLSFQLDSLSKFKDRLSQMLPDVGSLVVNTDLKAFVPTTTATSSTADNSIQSAGWSTAEIVFLSFLVFFLVFSVSLISLYIRLDHRHKSRSRQPADMYEDEARDAYIGRNTNDKVFQRNGDPEQNGTGGDVNIVPVSLLDQHPPPRRYISTSNPFELLYGASFMHSEKPKVEKKKASPKKKQTANIKPMLSITEEEQEHGDSIHSTTEWDGGVTSYLLRNMPWSSKAPEPAKEPDSYPFAFRDFPRHDGTPCLMYTPKEEEQVEFAPAAPGTVIDATTDVTMIIECIPSTSQHSLSKSMHSLSNSVHSTGSVDNFVDRLESLMVLKYKQFEERSRMEEERLQNKREREAKRATPAAPVEATPVVDLLDTGAPVVQVVEPPASPPSLVPPEKMSSPAGSISPADVTKITEGEEEQSGGVFA